MKTAKLTLTLLLALFVSATWAQGPNNSGTYYQAANGKKGEALKTALFNIIKSHKTLSYSALEDYYEYTDKRPDGCVRDWYSNITNYDWNDHGNNKEGAGWNKEHTVPQSWFGEASPMKSDIVHVVPTDAKINNMRSAYVIAEVGTVEKASANNYSLLGSCKTAGYTGKVFEPNDEVKGDIARIYFYMATCYQDKLKNWTKGEVKKVFTSDEYPGLQQWYLDMLFRWSQLDPIDDVERARNNAVASSDVQGNRNPFVDYPGLEHYVWGNKKDSIFSYDNYNGTNSSDPDYVAPPMFTPIAGSYKDSVNVKLSCSTPGANIYYKTDITTVIPSINDILYTDEGIGITETTTIQAIAYKDGKYSEMVSATYVIEDSGNEKPIDGEIILNNTFFGVSWSGAKPGSGADVLTGSENGITITYSLGTSANMFCNDEQIRMYGGNQLKVESGSSEMVKLEFITKDSTKELLLLNGGGKINGYTWTGKTNSVTFGSEANHIKMTSVKVTLATNEAAGIQDLKLSTANSLQVFDLQGRRVDNPTKGLYIVNGKKVIIK